MARFLSVFLAVACVLQTMAAPFSRRATTSPECSAFNVQAIIGIEAARNSLASINTAADIGTTRNLLEAQLSLLDANNGTTEISVAILGISST